MLQHRYQSMLDLMLTLLQLPHQVCMLQWLPNASRSSACRQRSNHHLRMHTCVPCQAISHANTSFNCQCCVYCSGAKRRSISRLANAALADDADLAFAAEHADGADLTSEAAAAVSNGVDISQLEVSKCCVSENKFMKPSCVVVSLLLCGSHSSNYQCRLNCLRW